MYEADVAGNRPSAAPEKLPWAMLLRVLHDARFRRQLMEQIQYHLLSDDSLGFRWDESRGCRVRFAKTGTADQHDAVIGFSTRCWPLRSR
jgi:hypothetical protein